MGVFTYVAKRRLEKTAFSISAATDVSADTTDDSFNSVTEDLSGLTNNQWVDVSGFTDAANNGFFKVSGSSTTTKITTDAALNLVTESAGNSISMQGYVRGSGQSYNLEIDLQQINLSEKSTKNVAESLSGVREILLHRETYYWDVTTLFITAAQLPQWQEFMSSVKAGETFSFDPYGTVASPDNVISVTLEGEPRYRRIGAGLLYSLSFRMRES